METQTVRGGMLRVAFVTSAATQFAFVDGRLAVADLVAVFFGGLILLRALGSPGAERFLPLLAPPAAFMALNLVAGWFELESIIVGAGPIVGVLLIIICVENFNLRAAQGGTIVLALANMVLAGLEFPVAVRSTGLFRFPNELAFFGACTVFLAFTLFKRPASQAAVAAMGLLCTLFSGGRSSLAAIVLILVVHGFRTLRSADNVSAHFRRLLLPVGAFACVMAVPASRRPLLATRDRFGRALTTIRDGDDFFYIDNWEAGVHRWLESPFFGHGAPEALVESATLIGRFIVHNTPISILVTTGVFGLALTIQIFRSISRYAPGKCDWILLAALFMPKLLFGYTLNTRIAWLTFGLALATGSEISRREDRDVPNPPKAIQRHLNQKQVLDA